MSITEAGLLLLPLGLGLLALRPTWLAYALIAATGFSATALVNVYSFTFGLTPFHYFALLLVAAFFFGDLKIPTTAHHRNVTILLSVFYLAILASLVSRAMKDGIDFGNITQSAFALSGILSTAAICFCFSGQQRISVALDWFVWAAVFVAAWGLFQLATISVGSSYPAWIFNNSASDSADFYDQKLFGAIRISSTAIEPSFFARHMVAATGLGLTLAAFYCGWRSLVYYGASGLCAATAILSTSTSAYVGLAALLVPWSLTSARRFLAAATTGCVGTGVVAVVDPLRFQAIIEATLEKTRSGSFYERRQTILAALSKLHEHPWFGVGWDRLAVYDLVVALLHHVGFFGLGAFLLIVLYAFAGDFVLPRAEELDREKSVLRNGLRLTFWAVIVIDLVAGISYVTGNLWIVLGLVLASLAPIQGQTRSHKHTPNISKCIDHHIA